MTGELERPDKSESEDDVRPIEIDALDVLLSAALKPHAAQSDFFAALNAVRKRRAAADTTPPRPRSPIFVPGDRLAGIASCEYVDAILDDVFDLVLSQDERELVAAATMAESHSFQPWHTVAQRLQLAPDLAIERFGLAASTHLRRSWRWLFPSRSRGGTVRQAMSALTESLSDRDPSASERDVLERRSRWYRSALHEIRELARRDIQRSLRVEIPILYVPDAASIERGDIFVARPEWPALEEAGLVVYALAKSALRRVVEDNQFARAGTRPGESTAKGIIDFFAFDVAPKSLTVALVRAQNYFSQLASVVVGHARTADYIARIRVQIARLKVATAQRPITLADVELLLEIGIEGGGRYAEDAANLLGFIAYRRGDLDCATRLIQRVIARAGTDTYGLETLAHAMTNLAAIQIARRQYGAAVILSERAQLLKEHLGVAPFGGSINLLCFWIMEATTYGDERAWYYLMKVLTSEVGRRYFERQLWGKGGENTLAEGLARTGFDQRVPQLAVPFSAAEWMGGQHVKWDSRHPEHDAVIV